MGVFKPWIHLPNLIAPQVLFERQEKNNVPSQTNVRQNQESQLQVGHHCEDFKRTIQAHAEEASIIFT
jgi:hypothetical protein